MKTLFSKYAKIFDSQNVYWDRDMTKNWLFLRYTERHANELLRSEKTVFINDIYKMLGFPRTKDGCVVGWHYDEENPIGDNEIIFDVISSDELPLPNYIAIDFNVDGDVRKYLED